ncbi:hypothetical protein [Radiobacillus deserti]|uniref:Uncharacterized protein n=1 Tax=Radiobacillus deserti TaxID=2594883 RepID=A0A516KJI8_9BACI|nr:hypothetical protein [Radiobacillus deserti]QDP41564.1 hypothetical protein FN924_16115 [Radiobacillus deserti]
MGFSIIFLLMIGVIAITSFVIPFIVFRKNEEGKSPRIISYVVVALLVLHWLFFLTGGYTLLPTNIADAIFMPVWFVLCAAGYFTAIYKFKNNKRFAIPVAGLTTISLLCSIFINGISNM